MGASIFDGFEGASLSPLWTQTGPGTVTLTTSSAFGGSQSAKFAQSPTFPYYAILEHDFGSAQYGLVSVYEQPGASNGQGAELYLSNADGSALAIFEKTGNGTFATRSSFGSGSETDFNFSTQTPLDWHQLEIVSDISGLTFRFDGTAIFTDSGHTTGFQLAGIDIHGLTFGSVFFDNFSAVTSDVSASPEPGSWLMFCMGSAGVFLRRGARRTPFR